MKGTFISFNRKLDKLLSLANQILANQVTMSQRDRNALTEYLISETWQAWNLFAKEIIIKSVQGCIARDGGGVVLRSNASNDYLRICYEASCYAKNKSVNATGHSHFMHYHGHTWGDTSKIIVVINGLLPTNKSRLLSGFGAMTHMRDIQLVRNACAHKTNEVISDLKSTLIAKYNSLTIKHPSDYAFASTLASNDIAYFVWVNEMKNTALYITESN